MKSQILEAIAVLTELPENRQAAVARAILAYAAEETSTYRLQEDERCEVMAGLAEIERGDIAGQADVARVHRRLGL